MSARPTSRNPDHRHSRRHSSQPSSSDSEDEKRSSAVPDGVSSGGRGTSRTRRRRGGEKRDSSRIDGDRDRYAVVRRNTSDDYADAYAVEPVRRRRAPSVASETTHYEEYDLRPKDRRGTGERRRGPAGREKRRSRLDPRVFLAALCCFAGLAWCWDEFTDD